MQIAEHPEATSYASFNEFFTRTLVSGARPVDPATDSIASPVDGAISQIGKVEGERLFQAKGKYFSLNALLANDETTPAVFNNGSYSTIYLSPKDYHRIHMPIDGRLIKMTFVPGCLFSVNESTTRSVEQLFARNERTICIFETALGKVAIILVGALFVGSMQTTWHGEVLARNLGEICNWDYDSKKDTALNFQKGEEIGRFNMGSTVILLFEAERAIWSQLLAPGSTVSMGESIASASQ